MLDNDPSSVNREPYGEGWLMKVKLTNPGETANLLSPEDYEKIAHD